MGEKSVAGPPAKAPAAKAPPPPPAKIATPPAVAKPTAPVSNAIAGGEKKAPMAPPEEVIDLKGKSTLELTESWKEYLATTRKATPVPVKFGALAAGTAHIQKESRGDTYQTTRTAGLPLSHPFFERLPVTPALAVKIDQSKVTGHVTVMAGERLMPGTNEIFEALQKHTDALGMLGFKLKLPSKPENRLESGDLVVGTSTPMHITLAGWLGGSLALKLVNEQITFQATVDVKVRGLDAGGQFTLTRDAKGTISGEADIAVAIAKLSGKAHVKYVEGDVSFTGTLTYTTEKIKGSVTLTVADFEEAEKAARAKIDPGNLMQAGRAEGEGPAAGAKEDKVGKGEKGMAAWGELEFAFTDWMTGKALAIIGPRGYLTVIGEIAPPKEVLLMKERPYNVHLFGTKIEARYGVPYVADIHVGIGIGLGASARIGPAILTAIKAQGVYSTDPTVLNSFSITGAFRISAFAGLNLRLDAHAGLTLLGHDINFGAGITATAGIKGYAEAQPTIGYREKEDPTAGKKGEYFLKGHLEIAAQPFLGLAGDLFVELDSPWWSPAPDKTWTWPLFNYEYPLPGEFGIGADVDYVVGSDQWPTIQWGKADFDSSKFTDSLLDKSVPDKKVGGDVQKQGKWKGEEPPPPTAAPTAPATGPEAPGKAAPKAGSPPAKAAKGGQTADEAANVPKTPDAAKRWMEGMKALGDLHDRAEMDPETDQEIHAHLAAIKSKFGFSRLEPTLEGDHWTVDAEMNPKLPKKGQGSKKSVEIKAEKKPEPKPPLTKEELALLAKPKPPKDENSEESKRWRHARYRRDGGDKTFEEWLPFSFGGRGGGPEHEEVRKDLVKQGKKYNAAGEVLKEEAVGDRAADVFWPKGPDGKPAYHQIGGTNRRGDPIARERRAIDDMRAQLGPDVNIYFHEKGTGRSWKNPDLKPGWKSLPAED